MKMVSTSKSEWLTEELTNLITSTPSGERLPSEPALAEKYNVSRATLRETMRAFETQGMIHRKQGIGTFVNHPTSRIEGELDIIESIERLAIKNKLAVNMINLTIQQRQAHQEETQIFGINPQDGVLEVCRVIESEGHPAAYLVDILPEGVISIRFLEENFSGSILELLLKDETNQLKYAKTDITAVPAPPKISRALGIQRGDVLLRFKTLIHDSSNRILNYALSYYLPGCFLFSIQRRIENSSTEPNSTAIKLKT